MKIWTYECPNCGEDTFGKYGDKVDECCSVCGAGIKWGDVREAEVAEVTREIVSKEAP